jgi:hypothetical protein
VEPVGGGGYGLADREQAEVELGHEAKIGIQTGIANHPCSSSGVSGTNPSGIAGALSSSAGLQTGQGAPAAPQLQAQSPSQGRSRWVSQTHRQLWQCTQNLISYPVCHFAPSCTAGFCRTGQLSIARSTMDASSKGFSAPPARSRKPIGYHRSVGRSCEQLLRRTGPLRFVDLRAEAVSLLGQKHAHSVGPILLTSGTFVRLLPGIYALPDQLPALTNIAFNPPAFMLNEERAKWLATARFAGEPYGSFPLWQPEVEYALCRWGETNANPILWRSLLAVASVDQWPASDREKEHWQSLQSRSGAYSLAAAMRIPFATLATLAPAPRGHAHSSHARQHQLNDR